jgi:hypothetical protein
MPLKIALCAALLALVEVARAGDAPSLSLPLACEPGRDCWIANYVDADPDEAARDYACGRMTYDGHKGTDFALRDLRAMADGVAVLAAADGIVASTRDGEPDRSVRERGRDAVKDRECGNGVRIVHQEGWSTMYCHLRRGSVAVRPGDRVAAHAALGLVGLSGETEFPHLHFGVYRERRPVDPFVGAGRPGACTAGEAPLWNAATLGALRYARGALYNFGVAPEPPDAEKARRGDYRSPALAPSAPLIALWVEIFGTLPGDKLRFVLLAPDGRELAARDFTISRTQARGFRWIAAKPGAGAWPAGTYRGKITYAGSENPPRLLSTAEMVIEVR